jgi:hypothetical protein
MDAKEGLRHVPSVGYGRQVVRKAAQSDFRNSTTSAFCEVGAVQRMVTGIIFTWAQALNALFVASSNAGDRATIAPTFRSVFAHPSSGLPIHLVLESRDVGKFNQPAAARARDS